MLPFIAVHMQMKCDADLIQHLELPFLELWEGWAAHTGRARAEVRALAGLHCAGMSIHLIISWTREATRDSESSPPPSSSPKAATAAYVVIPCPEFLVMSFVA